VTNASAEAEKIERRGGALDSQGGPRKKPSTAPPKTHAETKAADRLWAQGKTKTFLDPVYRTWYDKHRDERGLPTKFNAYIEHLLQQDQKIPAPEFLPAEDAEDVLEAPKEFHSDRAKANTRINCESLHCVLDLSAT
jgi:hypothetical protein